MLGLLNQSQHHERNSRRNCQPCAARFPKEFEICILAIQNQKAMQQIAELSAAQPEEPSE